MPKLPVVSGKEAIKAFGKLGYREVRAKGSHVRLRHPNPTSHKPLTVPLHKVLGPGLLRKLMRDAAISPKDFQKLL